MNKDDVILEHYPYHWGCDICIFFRMRRYLLTLVAIDIFDLVY